MEDDTMIKFDLPAPSIYEKGSAIAPVACNGKNHRHYVLASLDWTEEPDGSAGNLSPPSGFVQLE